MSMPAASQPLELWLPNLARFDADDPLRTLLARADRNEDGARGFMAGLAAYFVCAGGFSVGALSREMLAGDAGDATWLSADPAWVQPDVNGVRLLACGQMQLSMEEAQQLARPLKPIFGDAGMLLEISSPDRWHLRLPADTQVPTFASPEQALGEDIYDHLPQGNAGRRWRMLINETQIALHAHPLNAERRAQGLQPINSLWLWGGGRLPSRVTTRFNHVIGDDVLLQALAHRAGAIVLPRDVDKVASAASGWLVDLQDLPVERIRATWWPVIERLISRQAVLFAFDSGERWHHQPLHRFRFWRKAAQ